jgi:hypothetical protein
METAKFVTIVPDKTRSVFAIKGANMTTLIDDCAVDYYGYTIPENTSHKAKNVIQTLAECGCVEVFFDDDTIDESNELLSFAANYGITVYKRDCSFILCDHPVRKKI